MKFLIAFCLCLAVVSASQKYIIHYTDEAWESLTINSLPQDVVYVLKELKMVVAGLSSHEIFTFESQPGVTVYEDTEVRISGVQANPENWGLDRIDQHKLPLDRKFNYGNEGKDVDVYVIDSGILASHVEFGGRAIQAQNFANDGVNNDCNGHGTHVASSVGGTEAGVAKKARLIGLKTMGCDGRGDSRNTLAAVNYVIAEKKKNPAKKMVINMSLGGPRNEPSNLAVEGAVKAGIPVVVAAGNDFKDACAYSPASAASAITVAASGRNDEHAEFSNWGKCVKIHAPGVEIFGAYYAPGRNDAYAAASGTSQASPHVAGVIALMLAANVAKTPQEVAAKLFQLATPNVIKGAPAGTVNRLLYADPAWK